MNRIHKILIAFFVAVTVIVACKEEESIPTAAPKPVDSIVSGELPILELISDLSFKEGDFNKVLTLNFELNGRSDTKSSVVLQTENITALETEDYLSINAVQYDIDSGKSSFQVKISIIGDEIDEENETFYLRLSQAFGMRLSDSIYTIEIIDNDTTIEDTIDFYIPTSGYTSPSSYSGLNLIWADEFSGDSIDESNWTFETGIGNGGWGNNELQFYRRENAFQTAGYLVIEAKEEDYGNRNYTSSRMITENKFDFKYGRVDIRAALPKGKGIWPALWMLGSDFRTTGWPDCGEIDIVELIGGGINNKKVHGTIHWSNAGQYATWGGSYTLNDGIFYDEFHVFSIVWNENEIKWFVDDIEYHSGLILSSNNMDEFKRNFFLIFNVAVGGNWPGSPDASTEFSQRMIVDYVRVFQP